MTEVLTKAKELIKAAVEKEIVRVMAAAVESAKSEIADKALEEADGVLQVEPLYASIVDACASFDFSDHIPAKRDCE